MTQDEFDCLVNRIRWIKCLADSYEQEHDFDDDEDTSATYEMLAECRALADEMLAKMPTPEPIVMIPKDPSIPF